VTPIAIDMTNFSNAQRCSPSTNTVDRPEHILSDQFIFVCSNEQQSAKQAYSASVISINENEKYSLMSKL